MNAPQQVQQAQEAPGAPSLVQSPSEAMPTPWKAFFASVIAVSAGAVIFVGAQAYVPATAQDRAERITPADMEQLEKNRAALEANGLVAGTVYVRDYAVIDGDVVVLNGAPVPLVSSPTPLDITAGSVMLIAGAGQLGCVTVEIGDINGAYQLCLRDGDPIRTRAR